MNKYDDYKYKPFIIYVIQYDYIVSYNLNSFINDSVQ